MSKKLVILSGGMDSSVLLRYIVKDTNPKDVYAITFDYGQRISREIECAKAQAIECGIAEHKIIEMDFFRQISNMSALTNTDIDIPKAKDDIGNAQPVSYVPFRNLLLLTTAASWAESLGVTDIYYGAVETDDFSGYWDCSSSFLAKVNDVYALNRKNIVKIHAPFIQYTKAAVVKEGVENKTDFTNTHTCYEGKAVACGECVSCSARLKAFIDNKIIDPIPYSRDIPWAQYNCTVIPRK